MAISILTAAMTAISNTSYMGHGSIYNMNNIPLLGELSIYGTRIKQTEKKATFFSRNKHEIVLIYLPIDINLHPELVPLGHFAASD